jgi:hypothetical protein
MLGVLPPSSPQKQVLASLRYFLGRPAGSHPSQKFDLEIDGKIRRMLQKILLPFLLLVVFLVLPFKAFALYQPWIAEQAQRKAYNDKLATYSPASQQKTKALADLIVEVNNQKGNQMAAQMDAQAAILDEYQRRHGNDENDPKVAKARYWLTYAHEAVAFQQAKNYIFNLTSESHLKADLSPTVSQLENDLEATRKKVLNSQVIIQELVK